MTPKNQNSLKKTGEEGFEPPIFGNVKHMYMFRCLFRE